MRVPEAIDLYIGHLAREGRRPSTLRTYFRLLCDFSEQVGRRETHELELRDYERFLDRWTTSAPSTLASGVSLVTGFSRFLATRGLASGHLAEPLKRPRRQRPEDLDVVTISKLDVARMLSHAVTWQEFLCVSTAAYLGARRRALSGLRRGDVDLVHGTARFLEKGGKVAVKPLPDEYQQILLAAEADGLWTSPRDYLIPNRRPGAVRGPERSDKVIWETVKTVASRAGVRAHVHSLRAAFAVQYDEQHPDQVIALKELMGHTRIETTLVYLRRKDRARAMETVRDLSWGLSKQADAPQELRGTGAERSAVDSRLGLGSAPSMFSSDALEAHTGFEPVSRESGVPDSLRRKLEELRTKSRERVR